MSGRGTAQLPPATRAFLPLRSMWLLFAGAFACGDDGAGPGEFGGGDSTGSPTTTITATTTTASSATGADTGGGFEPDPVACVPGCTVAADCCTAMVPGGVVPPGVTCPGDYPYNWRCTSGGLCELGECSPSDSDAQCNALFTGFECMEIAGRGRCVAPCTDDASCVTDRNMAGTECVASDTMGKQYCRQPL